MRNLWLAMLVTSLVAGTGCVMDEMGGVEANLYGRIKTDLAFDTEPTNSNGNFVQWVSDTTTNGDQLALTANESRIGAKFNHGESLKGVVEVDFYGVGTAQNKAGVLLRKAYVDMDLGKGMRLLAGQTGDVFSPLLPAVLNYGWGWNCGNTGYRRPQLRFQYTAGDTNKVVAQVAAARSASESSAMPDLQARVGLVTDKKITAGVSTVFGYTDPAKNNILNGVGVDFNVPVGDKFVVRGEYFMGRNLSTYLGGIGQGVIGGAEVHTQGMWVQLGLKATEKCSINLGYLFDDPDAADLGPGDRDQNTCIFGNVRQKLNENTEAGLEVSYWTTDYLADTGYDNLRVQASVIFSF